MIKKDSQHPRAGNTRYCGKPKKYKQYLVDRQDKNLILTKFWNLGYSVRWTFGIKGYGADILRNIVILI